MSRVLCLAAILLAAAPVSAQRRIPRPPVNPAAGYTAPAGDAAVVVLLDENVEPLFPLLNNDNSVPDGAQVAREDRDVFAGVEAVRVTPQQRYSARIPGWNYQIVEKPTKANEFRYVRFAWKKLGGTGVMVQISTDQGWEQRYIAGQNNVGWPARSVARTIPTGWELVTRDLFKEFGPRTVHGFALTPLDGTAMLFDHFLLGRTTDDLDRATDEALGKTKPEKPLDGKDRDAAWDALLGGDRPKAAAALRQFLATAPDQVGYIADRIPKGDREIGGKIVKLIAQLDAPDFDDRQKASDALAKIGPPAVDALRSAALSGPSDEVRYRASEILRGKVGTVGGALTRSAQGSRFVRVLERAATPDAKDVLRKLAAGDYGPEYAEDAKAAAARLGMK